MHCLLRALPLALVIGVAGCRLEITAPVYMSAIGEVLSTGKPVEASIDIKVPIPTVENCEEYREQLIGLVDSAFGTVEFRGCQPGDQVFATLRTDFRFSPWKGLDAMAPAAGEVAVAAIGPDVDMPGYDVVELRVDAAAFTALNARIVQEMTVGFDSLQIDIELHNDEGSARTVGVSGVFVDGSPVVSWTEIQVANRDSAVIRLSDVQVAALTKGEPLVVLAIPNG